MDKTLDNGRRLKLCRRKLGLTQGALAEQFGLSTNKICRMENGNAIIPKEILDWLDEHDLDIPQGNVGARIAELRKSLGMNRNQFAEYVGCAGPTISRLENGKNAIERTLALKIAEKCHVGVDWLLTGDESRKMWPVDRTITDFLWDNPNVREMLYHMMDEQAGREE